MPIPNKILPPENLSTREKILRKIASLDGSTFTLREIQKRTKPRIKLEIVRYHVENLVSDLYVEKLPRRAFDPQVYRWNDQLLAQIKRDAVQDGPTIEYLKELRDIVVRALEGEPIDNRELNVVRRDLGETMEMVRTELNHLLSLYNCVDLWEIDSLTKRIGFDGNILYGYPDSADDPAD